MTNTFTYKSLDFSFFIYGRMNYWFNQGGEAQVARGNQRQIDYWTENNQDAEYQKPFYSVASGDVYSPSLGYMKADFLKFRYVTLGYNFPGKILNKCICLTCGCISRRPTPVCCFPRSISWIWM